AIDKLAKEVAFTHLNRFVAFKMMEARKLIRGTIDRYHDSNAFKFYLADDAHSEDLARYEAGDLPQNIIGEGPRDVAYRHFLLWQCAEMAKEIKVLFDPDDLASRLFPRPRALKELINMLNEPTLQEAWAPANDETIGWVYQYFNEQEKAEVFERLYKQKQKIRREDIPAATQLFTPRWIVSWLVQNTLGRHWMQMHPDSRLAERLNYLIPLKGEIPQIPLKKAREIYILDPACGTMHFGLVAFDLLMEMYKEELERAGTPGWSEKPSVQSEAEIPSSIVEHNLFGIDIDLRAVQLSVLTLYLKAKSVNPSTKIQHSNLACADVLLLNGERLDVFLKAMQFSRPIYERVIRALWSRLKDASYVGSLLRLEETIQDLVQRERERYYREGAGQLPFPELQRLFEKGANNEEFWSILEVQIIQAFDEFARQQAQQGVDETYFSGEATKGMRVLDVMLRRYDVVFTNPPYMTRRNMNSHMAEFLQPSYPRSKGDLYTAFIERCVEFMNKTGRLGMITQQSFMFISSYESMRKRLLENQVIEVMCHVGPRAFDEIGGEKVNTALFVLRHEPDSEQRN
ncbi:MAG: BREX-1 system adenine-specific DNA-methyltransferase PglX, partial [Nitrososphaera sp.]|nr:BREX-1 system adenine-specific DNA-methyltransferase PglX [Nitrososphaera sp.]